MDDEFRTVAEVPLEIDEQEPDRSYTAVEERSLALLGRDNRLGIALRDPQRVEPGDSDISRAAYDVALMMVVHAHPECQFVWSRLIVDLNPTPGAIIEDMAPSEIEDVPVEVETKVGVGLKFSTSISAANVELAPELTRKRTVYFPSVSASGTGFRKAYWDFQAKGDSYLHTNRELRLLISAPADAPVNARLLVRAKVRMRGVKNLIALRPRNGILESSIELVPKALD